MSACEKTGKPFFVVVVYVNVEYFVCEDVSVYCVEGLANVNCCEECSVCGLGLVEAFECCLCDVCEEGCGGVLGSEAVLGGGEGNVWGDVV